MRAILWRGLVLCALALGAALPLSAQTYNYTVYVDGDRNPATGCSVTLPGSANTVTGAETRLVATVDQPTLQVTSVVRQSCSGGNFSGGTNVGGGYPVGLNNGVGGTDVIELSDSLVALGGGLSAGQVRIYFAAANAGASDALFTPNGQPGPNGIFVGTPFLIPFLGLGGLLLLVGGFVLVAWRFHGRYPNAVRASAVVLLIGAGVAIAANFASDGQVGDWAGVQSAATDPAGDSTDGNSALDIRAGFGAFENDRLHFRIDVTDAENNPPVATPLAVTVLEDSGATTLTLAGTDLDNDPLTFAIVTPPTRGVLGPVTPVNATSATVTYTPNANANGTDTFTFRANDGQINSAAATATITITPVNDAPGFTAANPPAVNEDTGAQSIANWATFNPGPADEAGQTATYTISAVSNALLFSAAPAVAPNGTLTYTPAVNLNGTSTFTVTVQDSGGTANGGVNVSPPQTFTITINPINDAPTFTAGANQTVAEDAGPQTVNPWATAISAGPLDELGQALTFNVTGNTNAALFSAAPAVSPTGVLTYTPAANANGTATITLTLSDNGPGAPPPNANTSAAQTFTITVNAVNDGPLNTLPAAVTTDEDTAFAFTGVNAVSVADVDAGTSPIQVGLAVTGGTAGVAVTAGVTISNNNSANVVLTGPLAGINTALAGLSFAPTANANGAASLTVTTSDQGNTGTGGPLTDTDTIAITVTAINDAPVFTVGANQTVDEDAGAQTVNPWATGISAGPPDEAGQTLTFNVTGNTNAALFSTAPAVSPTGVLTYTSAPNASGSATITLTLSDNGPGAPPPNANTSPAQTFTITVNAVNDAPVNTVPGIQATGDTVPLVLSTANANAISVADVDAGTSLVQMTFATGAAANGTLTLANPGGGLATLTGNGTETVVATGTIAALNTALNGPAGALTYTPVVGTTAARTITVTTNDQGATGSGGPQTDVDTITVNADAPPVVTSTPANGATIAESAAIAVNFSEAVDVAAGITFTCTAGTVSGLGGTTGSNVTALNLTYTGVLGGTCTLTVPALSVTDVDTIDPPNNPVAPYTATFTVDAAPVVTGTPTNGATVANNVPIVLNFSEPVNVASLSSLTCGGPNLLIGATGTNVTTLTLPYTAPLPSGSCTLTVPANAIQDVDTIDPPNNPVGNYVVNFTVDAAPAFVSSVPAANGAVVGTGQVFSFTFDEPVTNVGGALSLNCGGTVAGTIGGSGTSTLSFTPTNPLTPGASCVVSTVFNQINDADAFDPPQNPVADVTRAFTVDVAPTITGVTPANAAIDVGLASNIVVTFSEPVNFGPTAFTLECPGGNAIPFTVTGSGTNTATIDPTPASLPINTLCVFTANAALVTDVDAADPPDAGTGTTSVSFTTVNDNAPRVTTNPANSGSNVAVNANVTVTFNEPVTLTGGWFQLACPTSGTRTSTGELTGTGITIIENTPDLVYTIDPTVNLATGELCSIIIDSVNVADNDAIDPPNELDGDASGDTIDGDADDYVAQFTTLDVAPTVTSVPANGATVPNNQTVTLNFSEPVDVAAGAITFQCGATPVAFTPALPQSNTSTLVLTPTSALLPGACTVTLESTLITDVDAVDPPNQLDGDASADVIDGDADDFSVSFTVDAPPAPLNVSVDVGGVPTFLPLGAGVFADIGTNVRVSLSENINATVAGATLECPAASPVAFAGLPVSNSANITIDPAIISLPGDTLCVLTLLPAGITDTDLVDPPNQLDGNGDGVEGDSISFSFRTQSVANNDNVTVTPHLTYTSPISVRANDNPPTTTVTGFGPTLATANDNVPNGTNAITASVAGGRVVMNADGTFVFHPDAGDSSASGTATFFYTITGGDTAQVTLTYENEEFVWFVDDNAAGTVCTGSNVGAQSCPATTVTTVAGVDTTNDTIFVFPGTYSGTAITLEAGTRLHGDGSATSLAVASGVSPIVGSAFPLLTGSAPTLTCTGTCVTLATNNAIRGLTIGNSGPSGTDIAGTAFGTLTMSELTLGGTGQALNLENGTVNATIASIESTSGAQNLRLIQLAGSLTVSGNTVLSGASGTALDIRNSTAAVSFNGAANSLTAPSGIGIFCQSAGLTANFTTLSATGGSNGLSFDGCSGTINGAGGSLNSTAGANNHVVNIVNTSGASAVNFTYGGTINKITQGRAVNIDGLGAPGAATFNGAVTASNASNGAAVQNTSRMVTFTTLSLGTAVARFAATPITLEGNTGAVSLGNVSIFTNGATGLDITYANASPGQVNTSPNSLIDASGAAAALIVSHATQQPLNLQFTSMTNTGAGTHGVSIDRGTGTLAVSGLTNLGAKTTAGLEIANSNNLAVSFGEVDITGATGDGVRLTNNGAGSTFDILGDGNFATVHTNGAGGTWTNLGGSAFSIDGARDIRVTDLTINGVGNYGVNGRGIVNLLFSNVDMSNLGNADNEHVFNLREGEVSGAPISGNFEVNNSIIENFTDNGVYLENFAGALNMRWTNNVLRNNISTTACGGGNCNGNGILLRADGTARINASIVNSTFENIDGIGLTANPEGSSGARMDLNVAQSTFDAATYAGPSNTNNGETAISLRNAQGNSTLNFRLFTNDIRDYTGELALGVVEIEGGDFTTTNGVINTLSIFHAHEGNALQIFADGANTTNPAATTNHTMNISMNAVNVPAATPVFGASILLQNNGAIPGSTVTGNYIITNSTLLANATGASRRTITANVRDANNACVDIRSNTVAAGTGGTQPAINLSYNGSGAVRLQGMAGSGDTNAIAYLGANNTLSVAAISGPNNNVTNATCTTPTLPVAFPFN